MGAEVGVLGTVCWVMVCGVVIFYFSLLLLISSGAKSRSFFLDHINPKPTSHSRTLLVIVTRLAVVCGGVSAVEYIRPKLSVPRCCDFRTLVGRGLLGPA